jgi:TP901 family phage tail tape measure protein
MVGFTIPLSMAATAAAKAYMDIEKASIAIARVYGDLNTSNKEVTTMVSQIKQLAGEYTKYGIAISDTMQMAAKAAAMGKTGADLLAQVNQASKLSALGMVDQQMALDTTISLTNAFGTSTEQLSNKINFLNAVENQTVLSIEDMTVAIPKAAPVVKQLGGDVEDLAFFLTAMREGGINASEGANALKSGLSSLINPTKTASDFLMGFGVNVKSIVEQDKGNLKKTVVDFASALDKIDPLNRARAIEMMFGKFQFARISTLLQNVNKEGSQASKALELANMSSIQLAAISRKELDKLQSSPAYKFEKTIADLQLKIAPIGETFLKAVTPIIEKVGEFLNGFNQMGDGFKQFVVVGAAVLGGLAPVLLMVVGLVANGAANIIKMFANVKAFLNKTTTESQVLGETTSYLTTEQIKAEAVAASLDQTHSKLKQTFTSETSAVIALMDAYAGAANAMSRLNVPVVPTSIGKGKKFASGGIISGPGSGTSDSIPAMVSSGEAIIPAKNVARFPGLVNGLVSGNIPGFKLGKGKGFSTSTISKFEEDFPGISNLTQAMQDSVMSLIKTTTSFYEEVNGNLASHTGVNAAHGNPRKQLSIEEARGIGEQMLSAGSSGRLVNRLREATMFGNEGVSAFSNLTFPMPRSANLGQISGKDLSSWITKDPQRFMSMIAENTGLSKDSPGLIKFANDVATKMSMAGSKAITESNFEEIIQSTITEQAEGAAKKALVASRDTYSTFNVTADPNVRAKREKAAKGVAMMADGSVTTTSGQQSYLRIKDRLRRTGDWARYDSEADNFVTKIIKGMVNRFNGAASETAQTASPSKRTKKIAKDTVDGYANELERGKKKVSDTAKRTTQAESDFVLRQLAIRKKQAEMVGADTAAIEKEIVARRQLLVAQKENVVAQTQEALQYSSPIGPVQAQKPGIGSRVAGKISRFVGSPGGMMGLALTASMAASALSTIPGPVGQTVGSFMPLINGVSMLLPILSMLPAGVMTAIAPLAPWILGIGAVIAGASIIIKLSNDARKKELNQIRATSDAFDRAGKSVKIVGELFGQPLAKSAVDFAPGTGQAISASQTNVIQTLLDSETFKDGGEMSKLAESFGKIQSEGQRKAFLLSYGFMLSGKGAADVNINALVSAIQQKAGKTDLKLDFRKLKIGSGPGNAAMQAATSTLFSGVETAATNYTDLRASTAAAQEKTAIFSQDTHNPYVKGTKEYNDALAQQVDLLVSVSDQQAAYFSANSSGATSAKNFIQGLSDSLVSGQISQKGYNIGIALMNKNLNSFKNETTKLGVLNKIFSTMDASVQAVANQLTSAANKAKYLQLVMLGGNLTGSEIFNVANAGSYVGSQFVPDNTSAIFEGATDRAKKQFKEMKKIMDSIYGDSSGDGGGTKKSDPFKDFFTSLADKRKSVATELAMRKDLLATGLDIVDAEKLAADSAAQQAYMAAKTKDEKAQVIAGLRQQLALEKQLQTAEQVAAEKAKKAVSDQQSKIDKKKAELKIPEQQAQVNQYNDALSVLSTQENAINKIYDERSAALDKIQKTQEAISAAQKDQLTVADALSKGDIAAAARAAQDARANSAQRSMEDQKSRLDKSKQAELDALTVSINGKLMTRKQIETQIEAIQARINKLQLDEISAMEVSLAQLQQVSTLADIAATKNGTPQAPPLASTIPTKVPSKTASPQLYKNWVAAGSPDPKRSPQTFGAWANNVAGLSMGGMVKPKYFAIGDLAKGTDIVPAMLTPGEFIVSQPAVKNFGVDNLRAINNGTAIGDSVYNYSLSVNMSGFNLNPNDVARAVMTQIRQVDAQRIRGNTF